jgi:hypothetical protein
MSGVVELRRTTKINGNVRFLKSVPCVSCGVYFPWKGAPITCVLFTNNCIQRKRYSIKMGLSCKTLTRKLTHRM